MNDFNLALADYLRKNKLTQAEFCRKTGYDKGQVSKWLKMVNKIGLKTVWRIQSTFPDFAADMDGHSKIRELKKPQHLDRINLELTPLDNWKSIIALMGMLEGLQKEVGNLKSELINLQSVGNSKIG